MSDTNDWADILEDMRLEAGLAKHKTRDPERIDQFLKELGVLWHTMPDMRFFQLIQSLQTMVDPAHRGALKVTYSTGAESEIPDCFYTEDNFTLDAIRMYGHFMQNPYQ